MATKDTEVRRLAILKSTTASISAFSVLNLSLEILKTETQAITVDRLFRTAEEILNRLPDLKRKVDTIALKAAIDAEKWVTKEDGSPSIDDYVAEFLDVAAPSDGSPSPKPEVSTASPKPETPSASPKPETPSAPSETPSPVEKPAYEKVVGTISAVSKSGKGVKIGDTWYNITSHTRSETTLEKGKRVEIEYVRGQTGFLVQTVKEAA